MSHELLLVLGQLRGRNAGKYDRVSLKVVEELKKAPFGLTFSQLLSRTKIKNHSSLAYALKKLERLGLTKKTETGIYIYTGNMKAFPHPPKEIIIEGFKYRLVEEEG